jgi:hypothetical protein
MNSDNDPYRYIQWSPSYKANLLHVQSNQKVALITITLVIVLYMETLFSYIYEILFLSYS